ncbi:hypothetical protein BD779DRAFT_1572783 [Infundibulicybe gibba]|nr:hypothetical protein BD779DRAFT_1572783 [Infundibulicybe gibba]
MHTFFIISIFAAVARVSLGTNFTVVVGPDETLTFSPNTISGAIFGDIVTFQFVTQSTFGNPCQQSGLTSSFKPVPGGPISSSEFSLLVNDTRPTWYFCAQSENLTLVSSHCQRGMVFAINPTADETFDMFQVTLERYLSQ